MTHSNDTCLRSFQEDLLIHYENALQDIEEVFFSLILFKEQLFTILTRLLSTKKRFFNFVKHI